MKSKELDINELRFELHENYNSNRSQILELISDLSRLIKTPTDAGLLVPLLSGYINANIKNDELLYKLITSFIKMNTSEDAGDLIPQEEREKLIQSYSESIKLKVIN